MSVHRNIGYFCEWPSNGLGMFDGDPFAAIIEHLKFIIRVQQEIDLPNCKMVVFEIEGEKYTMIYWKNERMVLDSSQAGVAEKADSVVDLVNNFIEKQRIV